MSDSDWDDNDTQTPTAPKALRDAYDAQKAENAALAKQLKDLADEVRTAKVEKKLTSKGVPEKAVGLFPKDVDPTDEKVAEWITEFGDLFGSSPTQTTSEPATEPAPTNQLASELEKMQAVSQTAPPVGPKNDLMAMLNNPNLVDEVPYEDFLAAMKANGALKT